MDQVIEPLECPTCGRKHRLNPPIRCACHTMFDRNGVIAKPVGLKNGLVGDSIEKFTTRIGVKKCGGCGKRQKLANRAGTRVAQFIGKVVK